MPEPDPLLVDPPPLLLDEDPFPELDPPLELPLELLPPLELPPPPPEPPEPLDEGPWVGANESGAAPLHATASERTSNPDQASTVLRTASSSVSKGCDTVRCKPSGFHPPFRAGRADFSTPT
jgi:hypothetical protein